MDNSAILYDEVTDEETNLNEKKANRKTQNFDISLAILSITIALLIPVSIYYNLMKYRAKQKHLLPFHFTNHKSKT